MTFRTFLKNLEKKYEEMEKKNKKENLEKRFNSFDDFCE
jgi:hypothetical protein